MESRHHACIHVEATACAAHHAQRHAHRHTARMQVAEGEQGSRVPVVDRLKQKAGPDALVSLTFKAEMSQGVC